MYMTFLCYLRHIMHATLPTTLSCSTRYLENNAGALEKGNAVLKYSRREEPKEPLNPSTV